MLTVTQAPLPPTETAPAAPHAIVIGSGFGGLAAAVRLGAKGYRVSVLERLDQPGGRASVFRQDGYVFDAGPSVITAPFLLEQLWQLCGRTMSDDIDLRRLDLFYRIRFHDGETFDYSGDPARMEAEIVRHAPEDLAGYRRFLAHCERFYRVGFEELGHVAFSSPADMVRQLPGLMRTGGYRTVYGLVARYIKNERLRQVFSFHPLLIGGNPFKITAIYCLINHLERAHGVHFPIGGTGALVRGLVKLIEGQGNRVMLDSEVKEILVNGQRATGVRLVSGDTMRADVVVTNADSMFTYRHMVTERVRRRWRDRRIERARYSMGLFVWYFGTDCRFEHVPQHTIMLGPRYRGLLEDIFTRKRLADDFSLYLHRPTATDPALAPDGCDSFYVLSPVPNTQSGIDWSAMAEPYRQRIVRHLEATLLPNLSRHVVTSHLLTPDDFATRYLSLHGAGFGLEPILMQSAYFRPTNRSEDIDGLYLVGAGTHPGAGVPGVLSSARVLDALVPHASAYA